MKTRARCVRTRMRRLGLPAVVGERGLTSQFVYIYIYVGKRIYCFNGSQRAGGQPFG